MVTEKALEALSIRSELALWKGRRCIYGPLRKVLSSEYVLKKDVVERMERSLLKYIPIFGGDYEDKLLKEKLEVDEAKKAYEQVVFYIEEGEKRISELEQQAEELREEGTYFKNKTEEGSAIMEMGAEHTAKSLILWCQLVEEGSLLANNISSFLEDLVVYMEHSNNGTVQQSETIPLEIRLNEIYEKTNKFFEDSQQGYVRMGLRDKMKHVSVNKIAMANNLELMLRENAMLYTIQNKMEELQKRLAETFAAMEDDGECLLDKLKKESRGLENPLSDERDIAEEKSSSQIDFPEHVEDKYEKQYGSFPSYSEDQSDIQKKAIFPEVTSNREENLNMEREKLLEGMALLLEELKRVRVDLQKSFKKSPSSLFGKHRMNFDIEEEVPVGVKKLEDDLEAWCRKLKEFRRRAKQHFPCVLDGFVSIESRCVTRGFEIEDAVARQTGYLTYIEELEQKMKTAEQQVTTFSIDVWR